MAGLIEILSLDGSDLGEDERIMKEIKKRNYGLIMTKLLNKRLTDIRI